MPSSFRKEDAEFRSIGYHVARDKVGATHEEAEEGTPASTTARCVYVTTGVLLQLLTHDLARVARSRDSSAP